MPRKIVVGTVIAVIIGLALGFSYYVSQINALPQSSYSIFDPLPSPTPADRILVVAPHQDDETIGVGGYIIEAVRAGATVEVIFATNGNKHGLKLARENEAENALKTLGVPKARIIFDNFPDGDLSSQKSFRPEIKSQIDVYRPTKVFTTLPEDLHPDHAACGQAVAAIVKEEPGAFTPEFFLVHYHRYPRPIGDDASNSYLLPPPALLKSNYDWQVSPLTAAEQNQKNQALKQYKTQTSDINPVLKQLVLSFDQKNELFATPESP
ncbi:MAG TPA: PIG-L deacetylase family protein [Candidatus Saccharimonadales bacterium]|nr:PIG-L deacetylase family protein [Candidatus Saccharimonadales bacterium]